MVAVAVAATICTVGAVAQQSQTQPAGDPLRIPQLDRLAQKIAAGETINIVMYGDSISEVGRSPRWHGGASAPDRNWGALLRDRFAEAYPDATFEVTHFSIGGQNAYEGLGRLDWLWEHDPDLVMVAFGTNDLWHHELPPYATKRALGELIEKVRERADVAVVSTAGNNPADPRFQHTAETVAATAEAAAEGGVPFVNMRDAILEVTEGGKQWGEYHLFPKNCHPNDAGHAVWADRAWEVIQRSLSLSPLPTGESTETESP